METRQAQIGKMEKQLQRWGQSSKRTLRIMLFLVIGILAAGCSKTDENSKSDDPGTAAERRDQAITASKKAAESIEDYGYAQKDEFVAAAKRELSDIQAEMGRLRTEIDSSTGAARADAEAKLKVVSDKWAVAKAQLDRAETATKGSWEEVQNQYRTARSDLKNSVDETRLWLSELVEP